MSQLSYSRVYSLTCLIAGAKAGSAAIVVTQAAAIVVTELNDSLVTLLNLRTHFIETVFMCI